MKKLFLAIFFILPFLLQAQSFNFNILTKYKTTFNDNERESVIYSNSKNDTFFLAIYKDDNQITARLYDTKSMKVYNFEILETKQNNEVFFDFKYKNSRRLTLDKSRFKNYEYDFKTINTDSLKPQLTLNIYENSKRKNTVLNLNCVTTKKTENLFHLFKFSCIHPFEFENFVPNENCLVEYAKGITSDNKTIEHRLTEITEVNFKLDIK